MSDVTVLVALTAEQRDELLGILDVWLAPDAVPTYADDISALRHALETGLEVAPPWHACGAMPNGQGAVGRGVGEGAWCGSGGFPFDLGTAAPFPPDAVGYTVQVAPPYPDETTITEIDLEPYRRSPALAEHVLREVARQAGLPLEHDGDPDA